MRRVALAAAFSVARGQSALVDGNLYASDPAEAVPYVGDAASAAIIEDIFQATKVAADTACDAARRALETAAGAVGVPVASAEQPAGLPAARFRDELARAGRTVTRWRGSPISSSPPDVTKNHAVVPRGVRSGADRRAPAGLDGAGRPGSDHRQPDRGRLERQRRGGLCALLRLAAFEDRLRRHGALQRARPRRSARAGGALAYLALHGVRGARVRCSTARANPSARRSSIR